MTKAEGFAREVEGLIERFGAIRRESDQYNEEEELIRTLHELKFPDYSTIDTDEWEELLQGLDPFRP